MMYSVWYDVWLKDDEKKETTHMSKPTVWNTFKDMGQVRQHVMRLSNRALLDKRTITITIHPMEH